MATRLRFEIVIILLLFPIFFWSQQPDPFFTEDYGSQQRWVDSLYSGLSLKERIGQLFMIEARSDKDEAYVQAKLKEVNDHKVGGVIFFKGGPLRQAKISNRLQQASAIPLLIAMDAEWGLSMRLDSTFAYPWNMTLGAVEDNSLIYQVGKRIGEHCKRLGVHINFAPVLDINTNPKNPIIGNRSFGEEKNLVAEKSLSFMQGLQDAGTYACGKHYPGHGDTEQDSHKTLPTINYNENHIDETELFPYKSLISNGLASIMVAHLNVPSLDSRPGFPSSLSELIIEERLKGKMGFNGLIFTDALNMKGVADYDSPGQIELMAFLAGNDMLLMSQDVAGAISRIEKAYQEGQITEGRLAYSVKKILKAKYRLGLSKKRIVETNHLIEDLNTYEDDMLYGKVVAQAITVVKNDGVLPILKLADKKIAYVGLGDDSGTVFYERLKRYTQVDFIQEKNLASLMKVLKPYDLVVIGFHRSSANPWKDYNFLDKDKVWLYEIAREHKVILDLFVKPYALLDLDSLENIEAIILSYQNQPIFQEKSAELLFGALSATGSVPVSIHPLIPAGTGIKLSAVGRLRYGIPEEVGIDRRRLSKVDSIARVAVKDQMTPGLQIIAARKGVVFYQNYLGTQTYTSKDSIHWDNLYDVASLTKILSTLPLVMHELEQEKISLETTLGELLSKARGTDKDSITLKAMLSHYSRLKPWIPFYRNTLDSLSQRPSKEFYSNRQDSRHSIQVAKDMYLRSDYPSVMIDTILESDLLEKLEYKYSDLPFYLMKTYLEEKTELTLDELISKFLYVPIGANYTGYNPLKRFKQDQIVPSEKDEYFRFQELRGYVHDMGAAMQGGIGGHAGVFSNANDIAKIMQMYLQNGYYGGHNYFKPGTIDKFNTCYYCDEDNRRGVGFDKPQIKDEGPTCGCVSMSSFGHLGFTGTYAWADPDENMIIVFLSNRTYPTMENNKLGEKNIRTEVQRLFYEAIEERYGAAN